MENVIDISTNLFNDKDAALVVVTPEDAKRFREAYLSAGHHFIKTKVRKCSDLEFRFNQFLQLIKTGILPLLYPPIEAESCSNLDCVEESANYVIFLAEFIENYPDFANIYIQFHVVLKICAEQLNAFWDAYLTYDHQKLLNKLEAAQTTEEVFEIICELTMDELLLPVLWPLQSRFDDMDVIKTILVYGQQEINHRL